MGSARRIAEGLMEHFLLTEEAYGKVKYIDALELGDEIHETLMDLVDNGELDETLEGLENLIRHLSKDRLNLMAAFAGVRKRKADE